MRAHLVASLIIISAGAACAPQTTTLPAPAAQAGNAIARQCFNAGSVTGFQVIDDQTIDLAVGANRYYRVELFGTCPDVRGAFGVGIQTRTGSGFICDDLDLDLIVPSESRREARRCPVTALRRLSEAEIAARRQPR